MGGQWGALIQSVSAGLQAINGNSTMKHAMDDALEGNARAREARENQYKTTQGYLDPYSKAGGSALDQLSRYTGEGGKWNKNFEMSDFQEDPGYAFRLQQGQQALERSAASKGRFQGGGMLKALTDYGQNMGSQEYGNAFNRFQTEKGNQYSQLMGLANIGYGASGQQAGYSQNYGDMLGRSAEEIGAIRSAEKLGQMKLWQEQDSRAAGAWAGYFGSQDAGKATDAKYDPGMFSQNNSQGNNQGNYNYANGYNQGGGYGGQGYNYAQGYNQNQNQWNQGGGYNYAQGYNGQGFNPSQGYSSSSQPANFSSQWQWGK